MLTKNEDNKVDVYKSAELNNIIRNCVGICVSCPKLYKAVHDV